MGVAAGRAVRQVIWLAGLLKARRVQKDPPYTTPAPSHLSHRRTIAPLDRRPV